MANADGTQDHTFSRALYRMHRCVSKGSTPRLFSGPFLARESPIHTRLNHTHTRTHACTPAADNTARGMRCVNKSLVAAFAQASYERANASLAAEARKSAISMSSGRL